MDEDLRAAMIAAAEEQLVASADGDIATRAVCEAVGVSQPVLYRLFGDKRGLLDALADQGFARYAAQKAALPATADPVADMHLGWDDHMAFAAANPALYELMFVPRPGAHAAARERVFGLLVDTLTRVAAAGRLAVPPRVAAQLLLSANVGVALNLIAQPDLFDDDLSHHMRDAVFARVLAGTVGEPEERPVRSAARRLRAQLELTGAVPELEPAETALLERWLERIEG